MVVDGERKGLGADFQVQDIQENLGKYQYIFPSMSLVLFLHKYCRARQ